MQKGGELVSIARRYKVSLKKIIEENNIRNPDFVASNTVLFIPDAKPLNVFSGFIWPAGTRFITCGYGWRRNPWDTRYTEFHPGLDIRSNFQMVKASKYGKVTYTGWLGGYGKAVVIAHPDGYKTLYAHLSRIMVQVRPVREAGPVHRLQRQHGPLYRRAPPLRDTERRAQHQPLRLFPKKEKIIKRCHYWECEYLPPDGYQEVHHRIEFTPLSVCTC